jgi:hypothetical protein
MHVTTLLEQFRTGETGTVRCVLVNTEGPDGKPINYDRKGDVYVAGVGDGIVRLFELLELRRKQSTFWYKFFYGKYACLELDISIRRLRESLNNVSVTWSE